MTGLALFGATPVTSKEAHRIWPIVALQESPGRQPAGLVRIIALLTHVEGMTALLQSFHEPALPVAVGRATLLTRYVGDPIMISIQQEISRQHAGTDTVTAYLVDITVWGIAVEKHHRCTSLGTLVCQM